MSKRPRPRNPIKPPKNRPVSQREYQACVFLVAGDDPEVAYLKAGYLPPSGGHKKRLGVVRDFFRRPIIIAQIAALRSEQLETLDAIASANWIVRRVVELHQYASEKVPDGDAEGCWRVRDPREARMTLELLHTIRMAASGALALQPEVIPLAQRLAYYAAEEERHVTNGSGKSGNGAAH